MSAGPRSAAMVVAVVLGAGVAKLFDLTDVDTSTSYALCVTALLGFGLYASTSGIHTDEFRSQFRTVLLAVTLGVAAKAALIFGVMYLVFRDPEHLVLGIAVAQIDPLSVAAVRTKSRLSKSAKALLAAWSSFDDPITVLLTIYVTAYALRSHGDASGGELLGAGLGGFALNLAWNVALAGVVYLGWRHARTWRPRPAARWVWGVVGLLTIAVVAISFSLLLALAVIGLFLRPGPRWNLDLLAQVAVLMATFAVGLVLVGGVSPGKGAMLGVAAYAAQIVVALVLTIPRMWRGDRGRLALGQQNGMTAIVLALLLEPSFPGTIAVVAPAIIVVNLLHALCNAAWDRLHRPVPDTKAAPSDPVNRRSAAPPAPERAEPAG